MSWCRRNEDDGSDDDDDVIAALTAGSGGGGSTKQVNLRIVPSYDSEGGYYDGEDVFYMCRYLFPWPIARFFTHTLGLLDCGVRITPPRMVARLCGIGRRGRGGGCSCSMFLAILALLFVGYLAWGYRRDLHAVLESPCYVCDRKTLRYRYDRGERLADMNRYGMFTHGVGCALDETMVRALDRERRLALENATWTRYGSYVALAGIPGEPRQQQPEDWRNAIPQLWVVGFRGGGTTSMAHYLDAHPDIAVRDSNAHHQKGVPWDDHFFAEIPNWGPTEIQDWLVRGWGEPTLRDHQGTGRVRVEVGPDYLWRASSGAAGAVRRAIGKDPGGARFLIVLSDPVRLAREAYEAAVDAGLEKRDSFAQIVREELPRLAECLWFGDADPEEQEQRVLEGQCGGAEPGRVGAPYLWRGLAAPFVHHWLRTVTPGNYGQWYAVRAEELLYAPNATLNRIVAGFAGLEPHDFGHAIERVWRPSPGVAKALAPQATWVQSWKAHLHRSEYIKQARKEVSDRLFDTAQHAAKRWVPGLAAGLKTAEKLRRLHCRLSGFVDPELVGTQQCLSGGGTSSSSSSSSSSSNVQQDQQNLKGEEEDLSIVDALRDFYAWDQQRLLYLLDAMDRDRLFPVAKKEKGGQWVRPASNEKDEDQVKTREFYLSPH
jgi:hypothetical protein